MTSSQLAATPLCYRFPDRLIQLGPKKAVPFSRLFPKLAALRPKTKLGKLALQLAAETSISTISIAAVSSYVYSITSAVLPTVTFQGSTPGPGLTNQQLQEAYDTFQQQFATFQGQAGLWINTNPANQEPSIFSQLVSVPGTLTALNAAVQADFVDLESLDPSSSSYQTIMTNLVNIIQAQQTSVNGLNQDMTTLGDQLQTGSQGLQTAATTGVLAQLISAYATEIDNLNSSIADLTNQISSDETQMVADSILLLSSVVVGLTGITLIWNPAGWLMLAEGVLGSYYAISNMITLEGQISVDKSEIQNDEVWQQDDETAAASVSSFTNQVLGFSSVNTAAQQELTQLEALLSTLSEDLGDAVTDLNDNDLSDALDEWNEVIEESAFLSEMTAYIWPSSLLLTYPTTFSSTGNQVYAVSQSGNVYSLTQGDTTWTTLPDTALSVVASGSLIVGIDGAPIDGSAVSGDPVLPTYFVKTYNTSTKTWSTISNFPAAAVTTDGTDIYAINQEMSNRQVYKYASPNNWQALPDLPGPDAAAQIAIAAGQLFVLTNNTQTVYKYDNGWVQTQQTKAARITGNGNYLAVITTSQDAYSIDVTKGGAPIKLGSAMASAAPLTTGQLYMITTALELESSNPQSAPTPLEANATGCFSGDTNQVYYTDNMANAWQLSGSDWVKLPALPTTQS